MPIEVMAERGDETLRFGPMKPVGLDNPRTGRWPYAVVQLRQDNALGTLWNMVGFQTKLKHGEQVRIFRTIPGLENAEFARLGGIHRNSFINSPRLLDHELRLKSKPNIRFAGQITGCEGYVESAAIGLIAARFAIAEQSGEMLLPPPAETALGALLGHITGGADAESFQPMNVNFGLMPPIVGRVKKADRKKLYTDRAREKLAEWLERERRRRAGLARKFDRRDQFGHPQQPRPDRFRNRDRKTVGDGVPRLEIARVDANQLHRPVGEAAGGNLAPIADLEPVCRGSLRKRSTRSPIAPSDPSMI